MILLILACILFIGYSLLLLRFRQSWKQLALYQPNHSASTRISLIIPARNEETNIGPLLSALQQQSYPAALTEIIVVDDHSTDRTAEIVQSFPAVTLIRLQEEGINSYKKKAGSLKSMPVTRYYMKNM